MKPLRRKILASYLVILVFMGCSGFFAFQKLSDLTVRVEDLATNLSAKLISAKNIAHHATLAGGYAQSFALSGLTSDQDGFNRHMELLRNSMGTLGSQPMGPRETMELQRIKTAASRYGEAFSSLSRLIDQRQKMIFGPLNENRFKIEKRFSAIRMAATAESDVHLFLAFGNAQDAFLSMLLHTSEYIRSGGDERFGVLFDKSFNNALASFGNLETAFTDPVKQKNTSLVKNNLFAYNTSFNDIRQGFREQAALLREMSEALSPEIAGASAGLVDQVEGLYREHNRQSPGILNRTTNAMLLFIAAALAGGLAIGVILSKKITRPLKEVMDTSRQIAGKDLKMLTRQMDSLARGDVRLKFNVTAVPLEIRSADELGETARAFNQIIFQLLEAEKAFGAMAGYLSRMTDAARAVAWGDLSVRVKKQSDHDLLGNAISMMTDRLARAGKQVARYQDGLEKLVEKRTADLEESRRLLQTLMSNLPGMAYRCLNDRDWSMEFVSEGAMDLTGYPPDNLIMNRKVAYGDLIHPDDREQVWEEVQAGVTSDRPFVLVYRIITKHRNTKWVWEKGRGIFDRENNLVALEGFISDITDQKLAQAERESFRDRLNQAQKREAIGTLAGGVAHDFNNILSGLFGYSQLIEISLGDAEKVKEYNDRILEGAKRASALVQQILTFTRKSESSKHHMNLFPILKEVLKLMRSTIPSNIEIVETLKNDPVILADPTQIHQVIMNLCTNAYHAMGDEGGRMEVGLDQVMLGQEHLPRGRALAPGKYLRLDVRDTGTGIDKEIREKIFDPYFTTKEKGKGSGLGLAVVDGIVKSHNGFLEFDSEPGRGTVFHIYFPVVDRKRKRRNQNPVEETAMALGSGKIMLVDDEEAILRTLEAILTRQGYEVKSFDNGQSALEAFAASPEAFDLIITDMTMPRMTGDQLSRRAMEIRSNIPIVICTGYHESFTKADAEAAGIKKYVEKPVSSPRLLKIIKELLG